MSNEPEMKIKALAPWFGGKRTLAPRIVAELGKHSAYWEPFCGSMSILMAKPESGHETVNDLHGELINLARVIQDPVAGAQLYRRLRRVLMDEQIREEMQAQTGGSIVDRAVRYFVSSWMGRNGFSGTTGCDQSSFAVRWTPTGGHGGQRFASAVESIPAWRRRMRRTVILNRDAFEILDKIDDHPQVAIYCDPPYLEKEAAYTHDFSRTDGGMFPDDHTRLAASLARFVKARVVVSYYAHERLAELYPARWTHIDCTMTKGIHNAGKRGSESRKAPEVLIVNGPSYTEGWLAAPHSSAAAGELARLEGKGKK